MSVAQETATDAVMLRTEHLEQRVRNALPI